MQLVTKYYRGIYMIICTYIVWYLFTFYYRYYENDEAVSKDSEIKNFANELSEQGVGTNGALGKVKINS